MARGVMARQRSAAVISMARPASRAGIFMRGRGRAARETGTDAAAAHGKPGRGRARTPGCRRDAQRESQLRGGGGKSMGLVLPSAAPTDRHLLRGQP